MRHLLERRAGCRGLSDALRAQATRVGKWIAYRSPRRQSQSVAFRSQSLPPDHGTGALSLRLLCLLAASFSLFFTASALAQTDQPAAEAGGTSFAAAFFISRGSILGTAIIWFLLVLSVFSVGLMGYMWLINRRIHILPEGLAERSRQLVIAQQYRELLGLLSADVSYFGRVLSAALHESAHGFGAMLRALEQAADEYTTRRLRQIEILNVIGNVAPMIGLFGTVYGMILAFQSIVAAGGRPSPVDLAAGIGTALVTTFWGLIIAIPSVAAYALIRNNVDALTSEAMLEAQDLVNRFRPSQAGAAPTAAAPAAAGAPTARVNRPTTPPGTGPTPGPGRPSA